MSKEALSAMLRNVRIAPGRESAITLEFVLINHSPRPILLAERWNSDGAFQWTFELTDAMGRKFPIVNPQGMWGMNFLTLFTVPARGAQRMYCKLFFGTVPREAFSTGSPPWARYDTKVFQYKPRTGRTAPWVYPVTIVGRFEAQLIRRGKLATSWQGKIETPPVVPGRSRYPLA
jgi:hypothetical protein